MFVVLLFLWLNLFFLSSRFCSKKNEFRSPNLIGERTKKWMKRKNMVKLAAVFVSFFFFDIEIIDIYGFIYFLVICYQDFFFLVFCMFNQKIRRLLYEMIKDLWTKSAGLKLFYTIFFFFANSIARTICNIIIFLKIHQNWKWKWGGF